MALTQKQENFCHNIVSGMNGKESYLAAYNANCTEQVAYNEASKLLLRKDIQQRIFDMRKPLEQAAQIKALSARDKQIEFIQSRIDHCLTTGDEQSIIRYTDMLNKINALYKETEQDTKPENNLNGLDINALKRLSGVG